MKSIFSASISCLCLSIICKHCICSSDKLYCLQTSLAVAINFIYAMLPVLKNFVHLLKLLKP